MSLSKLKIISALVVSFAIFGSTGVGLAYRTTFSTSGDVTYPLSASSVARLAPAPAKEQEETWSVESELVMNQGVRSELKLTKEDTESLDKVIKDWTQKYKDDFRKTGDKLAKGDGKPFLDLVQKANGDLGQRVRDILKPEQLRRLKQIQLRQKDIDAYAEPRLVKALKLSDKQKAITSEQVAEAHKKMTALIKANVRTPTREEWRQAKEAIYGPAVEKIRAALDGDQQKALADLLGEPFEYQREVPDQPSR